jgi:hypothetical protein
MYHYLELNLWVMLDGTSNTTSNLCLFSFEVNNILISNFI